MKFAAKRTWPDKAPTWEHQSEADDIESFALEFALLEQLAVESEFAVMQKDGAQTVRFFRVAATDPYRLEPAASRQGQQTSVLATGGGASEISGSPKPQTADSAESQPPVPTLGAAISTMFYMGKVFIIATTIIAVLGIVITSIRRSFE